jgi:hypothetical protein
MNYLILSKIYSLTKDDSELCQNSKVVIVKPIDYHELKELMDKYNYDTGPTFLVEIINVQTREEATASIDHPNRLLLSDGKYIGYCEKGTGTENIKGVIIKEYCDNSAEIDIRDEGLYCGKCFEKLNDQLSFSKIKSILESGDETYGLSTSKKIEYLLIKAKGKRMTAMEIYKQGSPWDLKTFTPKNSVFSRISILHKQNVIKKDPHGYWIPASVSLSTFTDSTPENQLK